MTWTTRHPAAVALDADRPSVMGSRWRRKAPEGDAWDYVAVVGIFDFGNDSGGKELVVQTVEFTGEPTLTADANSFLEAYIARGGRGRSPGLAARPNPRPRGEDSMIGTKLSEGRKRYAITAEHGGVFVLARLDAFEPPLTCTVAELSARFKVEASVPAQRTSAGRLGRAQRRV